MVRRRVGAALIGRANDPKLSLPEALADAIDAVASEHRSSCDLSHPATPSAAVAIVRLVDEALEHLVLADITVVLDLGGAIQTIVDDRVSTTARAERAAADLITLGSDGKTTALVQMKHAELAARNQPGGYWVAGADPSAAGEALTGAEDLAKVSRVAMLDRRGGPNRRRVPSAGLA